MHKPDPTLEGRTHTWDFEVNSIALKDATIRESLNDAYLSGQDKERDRWLLAIDQVLSVVADAHGDRARTRIRRLLNGIIRRTNAARDVSESHREAAQSTPLVTGMS